MSCEQNFSTNDLGSIVVYEFIDMVLIALRSLGGTARRLDVLEKIENMFGEHFSLHDKETLSKTNHIRWIHNSDRAVQILRKSKLLKPPSNPAGIWELT
jgi:hypothetical protein